MGSYVMAIYRPKEDKDVELLGCVRSHMDVLRQEDLVSDVEPIMLRSKDGTILEIFEWKSEEAFDAAHRNPHVRALWERFSQCCTHATLGSLPEAEKAFPHFETLETELPYAD